MGRERQFASTPEAEDPLQFAAECWYRTALLRVLIEDLHALISTDSQDSVCAVDARMIRYCESPIRELLERDWLGQTEEIARRNRSRLKVFDLRVGEGISRPAWLDLRLLEYTLNIWHRRLFEEQPALNRRLFTELETDTEDASHSTHTEQSNSISECPAVIVDRWICLVIEPVRGNGRSAAIANGAFARRLRAMIPVGR